MQRARAGQLFEFLLRTAAACVRPFCARGRGPCRTLATAYGGPSRSCGGAVVWGGVRQDSRIRARTLQLTLTVAVTVIDEQELLGRLLREAGRRPELAQTYGLLDDDEVRDALAVLAPQMVQPLTAPPRR
jgi:hypothetical protein